MGTPLVSIIIPLYNAEAYVAETIRSAMAQTWPNTEIIVVDDGSADNSLAIAKTFESNRLKVFTQPNRGASAARNRGLAEAKGEYIQFLDADDLLSADKIEKQVNELLTRPQKVAVCSTVHFLNGQTPADAAPSAYEEGFLFDDDDPAHFLINLWGGYSDSGSMITIHAWLTPAGLIKKAGPWNEELTVDDDGEFFCRVLLASDGITRTAGYNYYRKYSGGKANLSAAVSEQHLTSQFNALMLKNRHLSVFGNHPALQKAYVMGLHDVKFKAYPFYRNIDSLVDNELKKISFNTVIKYPFATQAGRILSAIVGWKLTRRLQLIKYGK